MHSLNVISMKGHSQVESKPRSHLLVLVHSSGGGSGGDNLRRRSELDHGTALHEAEAAPCEHLRKRST